MFYLLWTVLLIFFLGIRISISIKITMWWVIRNSVGSCQASVYQECFFLKLICWLANKNNTFNKSKYWHQRWIRETHIFVQLLSFTGFWSLVNTVLRNFRYGGFVTLLRLTCLIETKRGQLEQFTPIECKYYRPE